MCDKEAENFVALLGIYMCIKKKKKRKGKKRIWMEKWLSERDNRSHLHLLKDMEISSAKDFKNFLRMDATTYGELLSRITPVIQKKNTIMRDAITPNERLSATLRFLASGQSYEDLKFLTNISAQCLGKIILETCEAIVAQLKPFIKMSSQDQDECKHIQRLLVDEGRSNTSQRPTEYVLHDQVFPQIQKPFLDGLNFIE